MVTTAAATPAPTFIGATPPPNPDSHTLWLSTRLQDVRASNDPADHIRLMQGSYAWEGSRLQEPTVFYANGKYHMIYTGGNPTSVLGYASAPSPTGPWTKNSLPILGNGTGGESGQAQHSGVYVESGVIYVTYVSGADNNGFHLATASVTSPTVMTKQAGTWLGLPSPASGGTAQCGNTWIFKDDDGTYYAFFEYSVVNLGYQMGLATGPSPTGPWTFDATILSSLWSGNFQGQPGGTPLIPSGTPGGPWIAKENDTYIAFFHSVMPAPNWQTIAGEIFRATSTDLRTWTIDLNGEPLIRRADIYAVDQAADPSLCQAANGGPWFVYFSGFDNVNGVSIIYCTPLRPILKQWDGQQWDAIGGPSDTSRRRTEHYRAFVSSDFTSTTIGSDVAVTALAITYTPIRNARVTVTSKMKIKTSIAGAVTAKIKVSSGTVYAGDIEDDCTYEDAPAGSYRTYQMSMTFDLVQGKTYVFTGYVNNSAAGATTTVNAGVQNSKIEVRAIPN